MIRLFLALFLLAAPAAACELTSVSVIGYTHHAGADPSKFDEGFGIRGGGLTVDCRDYKITGSAYKNSLHDGGMGYSVSLTHDALALSLGGLEMRPMAQVNYYPDQADNPITRDGWFPSVAIAFRYDVTEDVSLFWNAYPAFMRDVSFDSLHVAGITFAF